MSVYEWKYDKMLTSRWISGQIEPRILMKSQKFSILFLINFDLDERATQYTHTLETYEQTKMSIWAFHEPQIVIKCIKLAYRMQHGHTSCCYYGQQTFIFGMSTSFFFSLKFIFQWENYVIFHIFSAVHIENTQSPVCMRACVLPFSWYSLQVLTIREKTNTRTLHINTFTLLRKLVWGSQNGNSQWFYFDTFLFMLPFVCFSIYHVDRINSRSVWFGTQKRAKKKNTTRLRSTFFHI